MKKQSCSIKGCKAKGRFVWDCCADGNKDRHLCGFHDMIINALFVSITQPKGWKKKLKSYLEEV